MNKENTKKKLSIFFSDAPIIEPESDTLNRNEIAKNITEILSNKISDQDSFVIGIDGEWGSGKTSLINLIKHYINNNAKPDEKLQNIGNISKFHQIKTIFFLKNISIYLYEKIKKYFKLYKHINIVLLLFSLIIFLLKYINSIWNFILIYPIIIFLIGMAVTLFHYLYISLKKNKLRNNQKFVIIDFQS